MTEQPQDELLTVKEFAQLFRRHPQSVYRTIQQGKLKYPIERPLGSGLFIRVPSSLVSRLRKRAA